jgi:hypothetical protein
MVHKTVVIVRVDYDLQFQEKWKYLLSRLYFEIVFYPFWHSKNSDVINRCFSKNRQF